MCLFIQIFPEKVLYKKGRFRTTKIALIFKALDVKSSLNYYLAPRVGFEPTTLRLTAGCSTVELPRKVTSNYSLKPYSSQQFIELKGIFLKSFLNFRNKY